NMDRAEKAWLSWSGPQRLLLFARTPGLGGQVFEKRLDLPGASLFFRGPEKERAVGLSNDGRYLYVQQGSPKGIWLERWSIPEGWRETVAPIEAGAVHESDDGQYLVYSRQ